MKNLKKLCVIFLSIFIVIIIKAEGYCAESAYLWPVPDSRNITQYANSGHIALDITASSDVPIVATKSGTVVKVLHGDEAPNWVGYGNGVVIYHGDGYYSHYAHMSSTAVSVNQTVTQGQLIGYMGNTGNSYGRHLHFQIKTVNYGGNDKAIYNSPGQINYIYNVAPADTTPPSMSNAVVSGLTSNGYVVTCNVSDNVGVTRVTFPTWTENGGQDDIIWADGAINGNTATFFVDASKHGYGQYVTHIYAYDAAGNSTNIRLQVLVPKPYTPVSVIEYNKHVYAMFDDSIGWDNAKSACESMGGHLATITSSSEREAVRKLFNSGIREHYYIGLYEESENNWKWVTGENYSYNSWLSGQPDNGTNEVVADEWRSLNGWNDISKNFGDCGFILEIDSLPSSKITGSYGGSNYQIYDVAMPYEVAQAYCKATGGRLAYIKDGNTDAYLTRLISSGILKNYFFGAYRDNVSSPWKTDVTSSLSYTNWAVNQPDGYLGLQCYGVKCKDGLWDDGFSYVSGVGFIKEAYSVGIKVTSPVNTYTQGEKVDTSKISVYLVFSDGTKKRITSGYTAPAINTSNPGSYTVTYKYMGYSGNYKYTVNASKASISKAVITLSATKFVYDGSAKKPIATVTLNGKKLTAGTDYTVAYSNNVNIGAGKILIKGKGNYINSAVKTFKIVPAKVTNVRQSKFYGSTRIVFAWDLEKGEVCYEIYYSNSRTSGFKKFDDLSSNTCVDSGLTPATRYYYKVRAYKMVGGVKYTGAFSNAISAITKPAAPLLSIAGSYRQIAVNLAKQQGVNGFEIYMSTNKTGTYSKIKTISNGYTLSYTKKYLSSGKTYYFKIRAYKTTGSGEKVFSGWSKIYGTYTK